MTTSTARSSEEVDVVDLHGLQQHDGVVLKLEGEEVEAPQMDFQIQSTRGGRLGFEEQVERRPALGHGGQNLCVAPCPSPHLI